jgi:N-methylhydantoinase A/oxoprolinase/acetone carboxylase beta subunit
MGSPDVALVRTNLGLVELERDHFERAQEVFRASCEALRESGREGYAIFSIAGLMACAAEGAEWDDLRAMLSEYALARDASGMVDEDLARPLARAARAARAAEQNTLADRLDELARQQFEALGLSDELEGR